MQKAHTLLFSCSQSVLAAGIQQNQPGTEQNASDNITQPMHAGNQPPHNHKGGECRQQGKKNVQNSRQRMRRCSFSLNSIKHLFSCRVSACFTVPPCACPLLWRHQGLWGRWFSRQGAAAWRAGWHPRQSGRAGHRRHGPAFPVYRFWLDR